MIYLCDVWVLGSHAITCQIAGHHGLEADDVVTRDDITCEELRVKGSPHTTAEKVVLDEVQPVGGHTDEGKPNNQGEGDEGPTHKSAAQPLLLPVPHQEATAIWE